jgi:hypothetical protein
LLDTLLCWHVARKEEDIHYYVKMHVVHDIPELEVRILSICLTFFENRSFINSFTFDIGMVFSYKAQVKHSNILNAVKATAERVIILELE